MFVWYEYLIVVVYILMILGIGVWFSNKGSQNVDEYFLGGKSLPWWVLGISFMTSNLDLTGTMVIASFFAMVGMKGFLVEMRGGTALALALFMVFMAKWHRRSGVMTIAEWMEFRFGKDTGAKAARLVSAIGVVILVVGMMTYFCVGFGKFLSLYFPFSPTVCTIIFTAIAAAHILFSGLYGVAFTDVLQGFMILFVVIYITVLAFASPVDMTQVNAAWQTMGLPGMTWAQWSDITPTWNAVFPSGYEAYNALGFLLIFWMLRMLLEGFGGPLIPYASQRFFAARDEREASLMTGISMFLFVIRWPLIIGVAILGLSLGADVPTDSEMIFPAVLSHYFPMGLRAVVVSCMVAAAMSTFDSTVNAGGAYIVNDIYRRFIKPEASPQALMRLSWISTIGLTAIALVLASLLTTINEIWGWISMGLFGGMAIPFLLRWYWERFNGWGYAIGTIVGISTAILQKFIWPELNEAWQLSIIGGLSLVASIVATLMTSATSQETVVEFYKKTRPIGFWPRAKKSISKDLLKSVKQENLRDMFSVVIALVFFFFLFLCPMYFVIRDWNMTVWSLLIVAASGVILYFSWYRHLKTE
jgi:Na+/proline symporter